MRATPQVKWAANQKLEALQHSDRVEFWARGAGNTPEFLGEVMFAALSDAVQARAMSDGIKKRINDACAGKNPADVVPAFCTHYNSGTEAWELRGITSRLDRGAMFSAMHEADKAFAARKGREPRTAEQFAAMHQSTPDDVLRLRLAVPEVAAAYAMLTAKGGSEAVLADFE